MMLSRDAAFVFVTGGVLSALGKGVAAASIGRLLVARGLSVTLLKVDPYLNVDPGTMSPYEHGEVFVAGRTETDLDLGHYERFLDRDLDGRNNVTAGQVYRAVLDREREGDYLGQTVQTIPHVTDEIQRRILGLADGDIDVVIAELGGTVGDIEGLPFLEALRQMRMDLGPGRTMFLHLTLVPYIETAGELKTKPTQHSVRRLMELGIQPDALLCRTDRALPEAVREKISLFTNLPLAAVVPARDVDSIYEIPLRLHDHGLDRLVTDHFGLETPAPALADWRRFVRRQRTPSGPELTVAMVGKYVGLEDAYKSVTEALGHAAAAEDVGLAIDWVDAEGLEAGGLDEARGAGWDAVVVPGGFGDRGFEGKVRAAGLARRRSLPFLGLCLGLQAAVVEAARSGAGLAGANSIEFDPDTPHPVVGLMETQREVTAKGGTMRLGPYPAALAEGSLVRALYGEPVVSERHRHRYEVNNDYRAALEAAGLRLSGLSPDGRLVEFVERPDHPYFVATQAHPEFASRPTRPHPLFRGLVAAGRERRTEGRQASG